MVTVTNFIKRKNANDEVFHVLEVQGQVEMLRAVNTGKYYAHARKATITSTLDEATCKTLIGTKFPGKIEKVECDEYQYNIPGTDETITLKHNYQYVAENANIEESVFQGDAV